MTNDNYSVQDFIKTLDDDTSKDSKILLEMMQRISAREPKIWNEHTIGFGFYHYKYDSGREGDSQILSFYPRKGKITIYLMDGTARYTGKLKELGRHTSTGYCIIIKRLSDINISVLQQLLEQSYKNIVSKSKNGPITQILWQTEK